MSNIKSQIGGPDGPAIEVEAVTISVHLQKRRDSESLDSAIVETQSFELGGTTYRVERFLPGDAVRVRTKAASIGREVLRLAGLESSLEVSEPEPGVTPDGAAVSRESKPSSAESLDQHMRRDLAIFVSETVPGAHPGLCDCNFDGEYDEDGVDRRHSWSVTLEFEGETNLRHPETGAEVSSRFDHFYRLVDPDCSHSVTLVFSAQWVRRWLDSLPEPAAGWEVIPSGSSDWWHAWKNGELLCAGRTYTLAVEFTHDPTTLGNSPGVDVTPSGVAPEIGDPREVPATPSPPPVVDPDLARCLSTAAQWLRAQDGAVAGTNLHDAAQRMADAGARAPSARLVELPDELCEDMTVEPGKVLFDGWIRAPWRVREIAAFLLRAADLAEELAVDESECGS
ncbi:MAG: hypothetical protein ACRBN8_19820 [Nannocystales bacterium]